MGFQEELTPTWGMALRIWWAITWRGFTFSLLPVFLLTIPISIVFVLLEQTVGVHPSVTASVSQMAGMLIGFTVQVYVIKKILNKDFVGFRVMVIKKSELPCQNTPAA